MSLKAILWVMESAPVVSHTELAVLYALADRASDDGTAAFPAQAWIAERARCSERTVKRQLKNLADRGVIRPGEERHVAYIRGDRRPLVWDLDLSLTRTATTGQNGIPSTDSNARTGGQPVTPSFTPRGDNVAPRGGLRGDSPGNTGCHAGSNGVTNQAPRGDTAMSPEPSLTPLKPSFNRSGGQEGEGSLRSVAPARESTPPPDIPAEWITDPRRARCAAHAGVDAPPPCRGCATARHAAEAVRDDNRRRAADAEERRRAERDACTLCDDNGMTPTDAGLMRCPHDEPALAEAVSVALAASETESDHDPADEPAGPSPALQAWRRRRETRTVRFDGKHLMPAIDHDPNEPMRGTA